MTEDGLKMRERIGILLMLGLVPVDYWWWDEIYDYFSTTWWLLFGVNGLMTLAGVLLLRWQSKPFDLENALRRRAEISTAIVKKSHDA